MLGGTRYERPLEAVDLYKEGWAPRILLIRQIADDGELELMKRGIPYPREIDVQIEVLGRLGVPAGDRWSLDEPDSTAKKRGACRLAHPRTLDDGDRRHVEAAHPAGPAGDARGDWPAPAPR